MASITETTVYEDTSQDDHIRSPFQLSKAKEKPVKLVSIPQSLASITSSPQDVKTTDSTVERSSSIDSSSDPVSPRSSSIGSNPFSLNIKKVSKSSVPPSPISSTLPTPATTTTVTSALPTTTSATDNKNTLKDGTERTAELQKEINTLGKEIEAKDAKLSSTLKSIKQFWSPELKKERAARKEETEKCLILKEKYQIASSQIEEYKNALEDLESEFQSQQKTIQELNEKLKSAHEQAKQEAIVESEQLQTKVKVQDDEIYILNKTLDDLDSKYNGLEEDIEEKNKCISDLEIILVDHEKQLADYEADRKEIDVLNNSIHEQEIDYQMLKKEYDDLKTVNEALVIAKDDSQQIDVLNEKITSLSMELDKQEKMYELSKEDVERFRKNDTDKQIRIDKLEDDLISKEKECEKLSHEIQQIQDQLATIERENEKIQVQLNETSAATDVAEQKDKEIRNLNTKYEKLDTYLSERENALELCRDELKEVKTANRDLRIEKDNLENQLFEHKTTVERYERQKERFTRSKEDVALVSAHNELKTKHDETMKELQSLQNQITEYEKSIEEKNEKMKGFEEESQIQTSNIENLEKELKEVKQEKSLLAQELDKMKNEKKAIAVDDTTSVNNKPSKMMWGEMAKKDGRIEELERQLKEKTKQLASLKKNQTTEREKQHHLVNESKKVEMEIKQLEDEKDKRGQRVGMLEDALRESVTIAVEREELLAGHKEMYENARNECEREKLEKKITNIKNAFLILSLSEKDALIVSMEATRKRQMEELFDIKHQRLLDSISEKDNQIGHLELQSSKTKKQDIKQLKMEKEKYVDELKAQTNSRVKVLSNGEKTCKNLLMTELEEAPPEQVYEAIRHLSTSTGKLEFYIEELFSNEQYKKDLVDLPNMPKKKCKSAESLKKLSKPELLKELKVVDADSNHLREFVLRLLDKLEGVA